MAFSCTRRKKFQFTIGDVRSPVVSYKKPFMNAQKVLLAGILITTSIASAQNAEQVLSKFNKIIVSPRVNLVLRKGDTESIRIVYNSIAQDKVNVKVSGHKLKIFLDKSRVTEKQVHSWYRGEKLSRGIYNGASITAYVTYKELKGLEVRGTEVVRCDDDLNPRKFKLKVYGESEINLASLHAEKLKASIYGENKITIKSGETDLQVYRLFGENRVESGGLKSKLTCTRIYGEGEIRVNASKEVRINTIGEPAIIVEGTPFISKGIVFGRPDIHVNY
jgi:hypothetical protein